MGARTYSVDQAAELLGVGRSTLYEAVQRGELHAIRIGRRIVIPRIEIHQLLGEPDPDQAANE